MYSVNDVRVGEMCSFVVNCIRQNMTAYFISWKQPNCSGWTEISEYRVTLEKTLFTKSTNVTLHDLPTGLQRMSVTAVNMCGETTTVELDVCNGTH